MSKTKALTHVESTIGNTSLLLAQRLMDRLDLSSSLYLKMEMENPGGSVKDRAALFMIDAAEREGTLVPGGTLVEPTSGNTGIGLALVAVARGYQVILTMPDTMSIERRTLLAAYGAHLVLTPGEEGMEGAIRKAQEIVSQHPDACLIGQFSNPANAQAHQETTSVEIWEQTRGNVDTFVAGIGTGGTITGVGRGLKQKNPAVSIIGVEPRESPFLTEGRGGVHKIQGIGAGFQPALLDLSVVDEIRPVSYEEAVAAIRLLRDTEAILCGISGGAALFIGIQLAKEKSKNRHVVVLLPDSGERYLSLGLWE